MYVPNDFYIIVCVSGRDETWKRSLGSKKLRLTKGLSKLVKLKEKNEVLSTLNLSQRTGIDPIYLKNQASKQATNQKNYKQIKPKNPKRTTLQKPPKIKS